MSPPAAGRSEPLVGVEAGDSVRGERIVCEFRRCRGPWVVRGTGKHRAQRIVLESLPAVARVERPFRRNGSPSED